MYSSAHCAHRLVVEADVARDLTQLFLEAVKCAQVLGGRGHLRVLGLQKLLVALIENVPDLPAQHYACPAHNRDRGRLVSGRRRLPGCLRPPGARSAGRSASPSPRPRPAQSRPRIRTLRLGPSLRRTSLLRHQTCIRAGYSGLHQTWAALHFSPWRKTGRLSKRKLHSKQSHMRQRPATCPSDRRKEA